VWKEKVKRLKIALKGWHINVEDNYKRQKKALLGKIEAPDIKSESSC
jgi:hypothetical protein